MNLLVFRIPNVDRYAKQIEFSPLLNGIGIVFSDGTAGLIICETSKFEPQVDNKECIALVMIIIQSWPFI
jgi:hypothetical protein